MEDGGINASKYLKIASNAHIITDFHLAEDSKDKQIGTPREATAQLTETSMPEKALELYNAQS